MESATEADFLDCVLNFFAQSDLQIRDDGRELRIAEYRAEDFRVCRWRARARALRGAGEVPLRQLHPIGNQNS